MRGHWYVAILGKRAERYLMGATIFQVQKTSGIINNAKRQCHNQIREVLKLFSLGFVLRIKLAVSKH